MPGLFAFPWRRAVLITPYPCMVGEPLYDVFIAPAVHFWYPTLYANNTSFHAVC